MKVWVKDNFIISKFKLPPLGQRIRKTGLAVFLCLFIHLLRGYQGMVAQSCVTAIICMQPFRKDSIQQAMERVLGTVIGAGWGLAFLQLLKWIPELSEAMLMVYALMAIGVVITLYSTVMIRQSNAAALAAIVFLGVVVSYPDIEAPVTQTCHQMIDTFIGIFVAGIVDAYHAPRVKHPEYLFFVRLQDMVPDRYAHVSSQVLVMLNRLFQDGARISLVSKWAPAFLLSQMGTMEINQPVIVMAGAAQYDIPNKQYLNVIPVREEDETYMAEKLLKIAGGYCLYAVRESNMFVYRIGNMNSMEEEDYQLMKRSPYRNYVSGEITEQDQIAFIRIIDSNENIDRYEEELLPLLPESMRLERRVQPRMAGCSGLYFFHKNATIEKQKEIMVQEFKEQGALGTVPVDMISQHGYRSEREAINLLNKLRDIYEPIK